MARRLGGTDWVENIDPDSGKKYYANVVTQVGELAPEQLRTGQAPFAAAAHASSCRRVPSSALSSPNQETSTSTSTHHHHL